ncbi:hypothetical protein [Variovorax sp. dw_954]|uniref:hypothetical protein n=1 Tax=Variovorax sp. dw_954 TaxID=2720078 RepID=UPI001BD42244|nr:hypothetical protein [Variovorax sp. dw_954]
MALSEDDLRGLSAVERETLLAAEADDTDGDIAQELSGVRTTPVAGTETNDDEAVTTAEEDAAAAAAATAAAAKTTPAAGEGEAAATTEEEEADTRVRNAPADIADQRKTLNAQEDESMQKLLDGEITQEEHAKVKNEVREKLDALLVAEASDKAVQNLEHAAMMKLYNTDLKSTVALGKAAGIDYLDGDTKKQFDRAVVMFSNEFAEQGIYDKPGNLVNSRAALAEAHAYMMRRAGKAAPAPTAAQATAAAAAVRPAPDRSKLGITLAAVPAASDPRISSKFAHLEGITNPAQLERELAKLSPAEQEEYLGA